MTPPVACVIGWPIAHSRSPLIHRHWLKTLGIEGDYVAQPVEPEALGRFLSGLYRETYVGGSVTVPHKETALALVAEADEVAAALGAVNSLWFDRGLLIGGNSDPHGFLANLDEQARGWADEPATAVVLGAGGAARAVVWALASRGFTDIVIVNRSGDRATALAAHFGKPARAAEWSDLPDLLRRASVLVNATSLGMIGQPPLELETAGMPDGALVTDLVYVPLETDLLRRARQRGLRAVDGMGMLLHQAVPGFERWFGRRPTVTKELRDLVATDIKGRHG